MMPLSERDPYRDRPRIRRYGGSASNTTPSRETRSSRGSLRSGAGLTTVDYLVDDLDLEATGHVRIDGVPSITPFTKGTPRHPTRLYTDQDRGITVLVAEQFVPPLPGDLLAEALLDWTEEHGVGEIAVLAGVPAAHGPDAHRTFRITTEDYRAARLGDGVDVPAMESGFFDGANAGLLERGLDSMLGVGCSSPRSTRRRPTSTPRCGSSTQPTPSTTSASTRPYWRRSRRRPAGGTRTSRSGSRSGSPRERTTGCTCDGPADSGARRRLRNRVQLGS